MDSIGGNSNLLSTIQAQLDYNKLDTDKINKTLNSKDSKQGKVAEAEQVAKEFETLFTNMMLKSMRSTAQPEDGSNAMGIYQDMLDGEYSKGMSNAQNMGVRDLILNWMKTSDPELAKLLEAKQNGKTEGNMETKSKTNDVINSIFPSGKTSPQSAIAQYKLQNNLQLRNK